MNDKNPLGGGFLIQSMPCSLIVPDAQPQTQYPEARSLSDLTDIIQALEDFQDFEPATRAVAIALYASELGISQLHFYVIALHAGLGVRS